MVSGRGQILLRANVRPYVTMVALPELTDLRYETFPHLPYSPDLSPFLNVLKQFMPKNILSQRRSKSAF